MRESSVARESIEEVGEVVKDIIKETWSVGREGERPVTISVRL